MPIPLDGGGFEVPTAHGQRGLQGQCNQHDEVGLDGQNHMQLEIQKVLSMVMELVVLWSRWS